MRRVYFKRERLGVKVIVHYLPGLISKHQRARRRARVTWIYRNSNRPIVSNLLHERTRANAGRYRKWDLSRSTEKFQWTFQLKQDFLGNLSPSSFDCLTELFDCLISTCSSSLSFCLPTNHSPRNFTGEWFHFKVTDKTISRRGHNIFRLSFNIFSWSRDNSLLISL